MVVLAFYPLEGPMPGEEKPPTLIRFGPFEADCQSQELKKQGVRLRLSRQSFQILKVLLERPGELVTREELRQTLWPSDTFVDFEHSLNAAVNRLRECLGDDADNPHYIETLPRRGYRFVAPIEGRGSKLGPTGQKLWAVLVVTILALAVVAGGLWHKSRQRAARPRGTPSIAVLPFADLSPSHDQEYFSDGLAEEILNDLAKIPNLRVVARTSAFQFKGKNEDLRVIGRKLNVENVLEGSVRREGTRVRITAQLVEANGGFHLWSESYDRDLNDVLTVQDDIATAVTSALQLKLLPGKSPTILPRSRTTSPEAYQDFLQSRNFATRMDKTSQQKALEYANEAIQADPHYAAAYALRASLTVNFGAGGWTEYSEAIENARRDIEKAIELDPNLADA